MGTVIGIILAALTLGFVAFPFFTNNQAVVSRKVNVPSKPKSNSNAEDIEAQILKLRRGGANLCPKCGAKNQSDARFCRLCAESLKKEKKNG